MHEAVAETVLHGVHSDVGKHPLAVGELRDAQRVVKTVAAGALSKRLTMPNGTKSPTIARPEAFSSARPGKRTQSAELPSPGSPGNSVNGRAAARRISIR